MVNGRPSQAAIDAADEVYAAERIAAAQRTPREQAEAARTPTLRHTVDELEDQIRADRGLEPIHARAEAER
jgi:hypothetical protein